MAPTEYQALFSRWCAARVPAAARQSRRIGYRIHGDQVTVVERRPPEFPELNSAWTTLAVVQLRHNDPEPGLWRIYRPSPDAADGWRPYDHPPSSTPEALLAEIEDDPTRIFWG